MAKYRITGPDGAQYDVEAPDDASQDQIIEYVKSNSSASAKPPEVPVEGVQPAPTVDNRSWLEKTQSTDNPVGAVLSAPDMFMRGMTGTGSDYLEAGMRYLTDRALGKKTSFDKNLSDVSQKYSNLSKNAPVIATAMEVAGAVTSPLFRVAGQGIRAGINAAPWLKNAPRYAKYMLEGGGIGAPIGAMIARDGQGGTPTINDVGGSALGGAVAGGALGAVAPAAIEIGAGALRTGASALTPILDRMPYRQPDAAARIIAKRLGQQGMSPDTAEAAMRALGPQAVLADLGKSTQRLADAMAQTPGQTAQLAEDVLGARSASQGTRLAKSVRDNISDQSYYGSQEANDKAMADSGEFFKSSFKNNKNVASSRLDRLLETPYGKEAMATARERMQNRMSRMAEPDPELTEQLNDLVARGEAAPVKGGVASGMKLETLDLIRQDLYEQMQAMKIKVARGDVKKGKYKELKDIYSDFRNELVNLDSTAQAGPNSLKAEGGDYERGLKAFADPAQRNAALKRGRKFATGDQELVEKEFNALNDSTKAAFRTGAARQMEADLRRTGNLPPALRGILKDTEVSDKVRAIAPSPQNHQNLINDFSNEVRFQGTANSVRGGSQTFGRGAEYDDVAANTVADLGGVIIDAARGNPIGALNKTVQYGLNQLRRLTVPESVRDRIGKALLSQDPAVQAEAFRAMRDFQSRVPSFTPSRDLLSLAPRVGSSTFVEGSNQ